MSTLHSAVVKCRRLNGKLPGTDANLEPFVFTAVQHLKMLGWFIISLFFFLSFHPSTPSLSLYPLTLSLSLSLFLSLSISTSLSLSPPLSLPLYPSLPLPPPPLSLSPSLSLSLP